MAGETLLSADETLAGFPDNTQGLILPLDVRNFVVSAAVSIGFMEDSGPWTIPLAERTGCQAVGVDTSPGMLKKARAKDGQGCV